MNLNEPEKTESGCCSNKQPVPPSPELAGLEGEVTVEAMTLAAAGSFARLSRSVMEPSKELLDSLMCSLSFLDQGARSSRQSLLQQISDAGADNPELAELLQRLGCEFDVLDKRVAELERRFRPTGTFASGATSPAAITLGQVMGGELGFVDVDTVSLGTAGRASAAFDSTNTVKIAWSGVLSADITISGAGGLDSGTETGDTFYAVHVIQDPTQSLPPAALLSLSATAPVLPTGYAYFRRLGWVRNDASSDFIPFLQCLEGVDRTVWYDNVLIVLSGGTATTFTAVSCAAFIPSTSRQAFILTAFDNAAGSDADFYAVRPTGFTFFIPPWLGIPGIVNPSIATLPFTMPVSASQEIEYAVSDAVTSLTVAVQGYTDQLYL